MGARLKPTERGKMTTNRAFSGLFLVLILIAGFSASSITFTLYGRDAGVASSSGPPAFPSTLGQLFMLSLLGLLCAAYRRCKGSTETREDLHNILSSIQPMALMVVSEDRKIRMCNPAVARVFGYSAHELLNRKTDLLYGDRRSHPVQHREIYEVLEREGFHVGTAQGIRKNGETFPLEIITGNLSGENGAVLLLQDISDRQWAEEQMKNSRDALEILVHNRTDRLVNTLDDLLREISERKQAEETVKRLNQELERRVSERTRELETAYQDLKQIDRLKDDFLSTVSHEFRTPLTSIMSFSEILLDFPEESKETKQEFYSIIYNESQRLSRLINDLLDLSKIQAGKMEWRRQKLDAAQIVDMALQSVQGLGTKRELRLERDVLPDLPMFFGDPDRILQVLINLLSNAIKFTPGGGSVRIRAVQEEGTTAGSTGPHIHFMVEDSGKGIHPEDLNRIFERFSQCVDDPTKKPHGTGLGLSICRKILSAHRGEIWAESTAGQGSTFHVLIPLDGRKHEEPETVRTQSAVVETLTLLH